MTDKVKEFVKKLNSDKALLEEYKALIPEDKSKIDRDAFLRDTILPFAKKAGYDLSMEDFKPDVPQNGEISDDELSAVAGGYCVCAGIGGGDGTDWADGGGSYGCGCVMYGQGGNGSIDDANCVCGGVGHGDDCLDIY